MLIATLPRRRPATAAARGGACRGAASTRRGASTPMGGKTLQTGTRSAKGTQRAQLDQTASGSTKRPTEGGPDRQD
eukprot:6299088-Lingulodinium_polyedra.AAC.1